MPGRKPKPTALHLIEGTARPCRINREEPAVVIGAPECPEWMIGDAREEWNFLVSYLSGCRVLSPQDKLGLISLCVLTAKLYEAGRQGEVLNSGLIGQHRGLLSEFGLTPASRAKIRVNKPEKVKDGWADLAKKA